MIVAARCERCGFERAPLRVGASMAQMSGERRSAFHVFRCGACRGLAEVEVFLGEPSGEPGCDRCRAPLSLLRELEVRVVTMRGLALSGHGCPSCGEPGLTFTETGSFL